MPEYVGIEEFAEIYGCTVRYAQKLVRDGKCPRYRRFGRKIRFIKSDIEDWVARHTFNPDNE